MLRLWPVCAYSQALNRDRRRWVGQAADKKGLPWERQANLLWGGRIRVGLEVKPNPTAGDRNLSSD